MGFSFTNFDVRTYTFASEISDRIRGKVARQHVYFTVAKK